MKYRHKEAIAQWFAWHLPPRIVYWCYMRVFGHATSGKYGMRNIDTDVDWKVAADTWTKDFNL